MKFEQKKCVWCDKEFKRELAKDAYFGENCFDCSFWLKKVGKPGQVIVNSIHYRINNTTEPFRGFGGRTFNIIFHNGRKIETNSLWCQGEIPIEFRELLPDNAIFAPFQPTNPIVNAYDIPIQKENNMIFRTECAWCGVFMHEKKCSVTKHCQNLAKRGIITSHGICKHCKKAVEIEYKSKLEGGNKQICIG